MKTFWVYMFSLSVFLFNTEFAQANEQKLIAFNIKAGPKLGSSVSPDKMYAVVRDVWDDDNGDLYNLGSAYAYSDFVSSIEEVMAGTTNSFNLNENYPNPFNPTTKINYSLPTSLFVTLKVYDVVGNEVATLVNKELSAGEYEVEFSSNRHSREGGNLTSGVYFYQLRAGSIIKSKKMVLMK